MAIFQQLAQQFGFGGDDDDKDKDQEKAGPFRRAARQTRQPTEVEKEAKQSLPKRERERRRKQKQRKQSIPARDITDVEQEKPSPQPKQSRPKEKKEESIIDLDPFEKTSPFQALAQQQKAKPPEKPEPEPLVLDQEAAGQAKDQIETNISALENRREEIEKTDDKLDKLREQGKKQEFNQLLQERNEKLRDLKGLAQEVGKFEDATIVQPDQPGPSKTGEIVGSLLPEIGEDVQRKEGFDPSLERFSEATIASLGSMITDTLDFAVDNVERFTEGPFTEGEKPKGKAAKLVTLPSRKLNSFLQQLSEQTGALAADVERFEQEQAILPSKEQQEGKFTTNLIERPVETTYNMIPALASSFAPYLAGPVAGTATIAGSTGKNIEDEAVKNGVDKDTAGFLGVLGGGLVSVIDRIVPDKVLPQGTKKNFVGNLSRRILKTSIAEAGTEVAQEDIQAAIESTYKDLDLSELGQRNLKAAFGGALGGATIQGLTDFSNKIATGEIQPGLTTQDILNKSIQDEINRSFKKAESFQDFKRELQSEEGTQVDVGEVQEKLVESGGSLGQIFMSKKLQQQKNEAKKPFEVMAESQAKEARTPFQALAEQEGVALQKPSFETKQQTEAGLKSLKSAREAGNFREAEIIADRLRFAESLDEAQKSAGIELQQEQDLLSEQIGKEQPSRIEPSKAEELTRKREEAKQERAQEIFEETQKIEQARETDLTFSDSELEQGFEKFKELNKRSKKIKGGEVEDAQAFREFLTKDEGKFKEFQSTEKVDNVLFENQSGLSDNQALQAFRERLRSEQRLKQIADKDSPQELIEQKQQEIERIVDEAKIGEDVKAKTQVREETGQTKAKQQKEEGKLVTERKSLREKMRAQAKGARVGARAERKKAEKKLKQQKNELVEKFRNRSDVTTELIDDLRSFAQQNLDRSSNKQSAFTIARNISEAVNIDTKKRRFGKGLSRIFLMAEKEQKRQVVNHVKELRKKIKQSPSVDVEYKQEAERILSQVDLRKRTDKTQKRIEKKQAFVKRERQKGKSEEEIMAQLDDKSKELLERGKKTKFENVTYRRLSNIAYQLEQIDQLGRLKVDTRRQLEKNKKEFILQEIIEGETKKLNNRELNKADELEEGGLSLTEKIQNHIDNAINKASEVDKSLLQTDALFDMMDGAQGNYDGPVYKNFKGRLDTDWNNFMNRVFEWTSQISDIAEKNDYSQTQRNRIGAKLAYMQDNGTKKLEESGLDVDKVAKMELNKGEQEFVDKWRELEAEIFPQVQEVMKNVYNKKVNKVKNYFPFATDWEKMDERNVEERFGPDVARKNVEQGFTEQRKDVGSAINIDAIEVANNHLRNVAYLLEMGPDIKMLQETAKTDEFAEQVGDMGATLTQDWLDTMAIAGGPNGAVANWERFLNSLRKNTSSGILGFRLSTVLIQPTAFFDGAADIGGYWSSGGMKDVVTKKRWREFVTKFPELKNRFGGEIDIKELTDDSWWQKIRQKGFIPMQKVDSIVAMGIAAGAYKKRMKQLGEKVDLENINEDAMGFAQRAVRKTQASAEFKDVPMAISRDAVTGSRALNKAFLQFQTFALSRWRQLRYDTAQVGVKKGNRKQAAQRLGWLTSAMIVGAGISTATWRAKGWIVEQITSAITGEEPEEDEDDKDFGDEMWNRFMMEATGSVPLTGNLISKFKYGGSLMPLADAFQSGGESLVGIFNSKNPDTVLRNYIRFAQALAQARGIPISEAEGLLVDFLKKESVKKKIRAKGTGQIEQFIKDVFLRTGKADKTLLKEVMDADSPEERQEILSGLEQEEREKLRNQGKTRATEAAVDIYGRMREGEDFDKEKVRSENSRLIESGFADLKMIDEEITKLKEDDAERIAKNLVSQQKKGVEINKDMVREQAGKLIENDLLDLKMIDNAMTDIKEDKAKEIAQELVEREQIGEEITKKKIRSEFADLLQNDIVDLQMIDEEMTDIKED